LPEPPRGKWFSYRRPPRARLVRAAPPTRTSLRPAPCATPGLPACLPPCPGWPAQLAPCIAGHKQRGQGRAGCWPVATWPGTKVRESRPVTTPLRCLAPRSARASGTAFWPRSPPLGPEKRAPAPPASHPSGATAWPAPKSVVVIGGAPEENGLLILATSYYSKKLYTYN
jgi:hypothetical protein